MRSCPVRPRRLLQHGTWKICEVSCNRMAANYAVQTPGEFMGYVISADKAQEWAERLNKLLAHAALAQPNAGKAPAAGDAKEGSDVRT